MSWSRLRAGTHYSGYPFPCTTHHLPPLLVTLALLCLSGSLSTPNFIIETTVTISWSQLEYTQRPCIFISFLTARPTLTSRPPPLSSYFGLVFLAFMPAFSVLVAPPFSHIRLFHTPHACLGLLLPSSLCPLSSPARPLTLLFAPGLPISMHKMYGHF